MTADEKHLEDARKAEFVRQKMEMAEEVLALKKDAHQKRFWGSIAGLSAITGSLALGIVGAPLVGVAAGLFGAAAATGFLLKAEQEEKKAVERGQPQGSEDFRRMIDPSREAE